MRKRGAGRHTCPMYRVSHLAKQWKINNGINFDFERFIHYEGFLIVGCFMVIQGLY